MKFVMSCTLVLSVSLLIGPCGGCSDEPLPTDLEQGSVWRPSLSIKDFKESDFRVGSDFREPQLRLRTVDTTIRKTIELLEGAGKQKHSNELLRRLTRVLKFNLSKTTDSRDEARLHVVGLYEGSKNEGGAAAVHVTDTSGPVVLCVCAYESVRWTITAAPCVDLRRVILAGYEPQSVEEIPKGVVIEGHPHQSDNSNYRFDAYDGVSQWLVVDRHLHRLTGLEVSSRQGMYRFKNKPFVVGPGNSEWVAQVKLGMLKPLLRESMLFQVQNLETEVTAAAFPMISRSVGHAEGGEYGGSASCSIATASVFGPFVDTMQPVQGSIHNVVHHPQRGFYTLHDKGVARLDSETGVLTPLEIQDLESVAGDWPVALDFNNDRLYVWGHRLSSIDLKTETIRIHREGNSGSIVSLTYSPKDGCLYGLGAPYDGSSSNSVRDLYKLNLRGAEIARVPIGTPIPSDVRPQLISVENRLVVVAYQRNSREQLNYVVDPETGSTVFACVRKPRQTVSVGNGR